jgi:hypothetical protein
MQQNKTSKYFKYAIGEIVLVVIGILIALSINNWNENKKSNINFNKSLVNVFNDLDFDLESAQRVIAYYKNKDTLATNIVDGKYSVTEYREGRVPTNLITSHSAFNITDMGYRQLMQNADNIPSEYDQLVADINHQYITKARLLESDYASLTKLIDGVRLRYSLSFPWYSQRDSISKEKRWQHFANDPIYKNEVQAYRSDACNNYALKVGWFYNDGLILYLKLKTIIKDTNPLPRFFPKNADDYDRFKFDYLGKYLTPSGNTIFIKENNDYLYIHSLDGKPLVLLSLVSKDIFINHNNGIILTFKRDDSNKVIGWHNGLNTVTKIKSND